MIRAECRLYQSATPYFPFRELLSEAWGLGGLGPGASEKALAELVDTLAPELHPWLSLIGLPLGLEIAESVEVSQLEDQFRPQRTIAAVGAFLEATVTDPVMFVLEDTHWMDEPSRELLADLGSRLERHPWMFVLTRPPGEEGFVAPIAPSVSRIELDPLGLDEARDLIFAATESAPISQEQADALARQANGNPFFLIELLQGSPLHRVAHGDPTECGGDRRDPNRLTATVRSERASPTLGARQAVSPRSGLSGTGEEGEDPQDHSHAVERLSDFVTLDDGQVGSSSTTR